MVPPPVTNIFSPVPKPNFDLVCIMWWISARLYANLLIDLNLCIFYFVQNNLGISYDFLLGL